MVDIEVKPDSKKPMWLITDEQEQGVGHLHYRLGARSHRWRPPTDVYETDEAIIVRVEIAGMKHSAFTISLDGKTLTIKGERPDQAERRAFHQLEIHYGEFSTEVELHWSIDSDGVEAEYKDGILRLVLPKTVPHQVKIGR